MEPEYFYTLDLGATFGPRLERLAARAGKTDVEAFAALMLAEAIEQTERDFDEVDARREARGPLPDIDDGIPF